MWETMRNAFKIPELRAKLLFTLMILVLYRFGASVPIPFVDSAALQAIFSSQGDTIFGYMNILSGNAFSRATLLALSITPYITASIIMQLLTIAIPALERLQKSGDEGRKKINQMSRYLTIVLGLITGYGYYLFLRNTQVSAGQYLITNRGVFAGVVIVACYSAGSALIMWLGEKINENGIGNGISIILFANIISVLPSTVGTTLQTIINTATNSSKAAGDVVLEVVKALAVLLIALVIVGFVVWMSNAERKIQVQYSKRVVGRKMYGGQSTYLPIKVNMSGVMPIIFANSIVTLPITIITLVNGNQTPDKGTFARVLHDLFSSTSILYIVLTFALIIAFSYFYISISFNPVEVSNNLKKNGGFIPGIRPGKPTTDYITRILNKIVLIGGVFLGVIAVFPLSANAIATAFGAAGSSIAFGGSSLLIVVGVALETVREIEAQMTMRHYKGFLE